MTLLLRSSGMWAIIDVFQNRFFFLKKVKHFSVVDGWYIIRNLTQKFQTFSTQVYNYRRTVYHHNGPWP